MFCLVGLPSLAQSDWSRVYPAPGKPSIALEIPYGNLQIRSCGECREVRIRVQWNGRKPENYHLEENQTGNNIRFLLRVQRAVDLGFFERLSQGDILVILDTPAQLSLDAHTSDGRVTLKDLHGDLSFQSGDASFNLANVDGNVRLRLNDGDVKVDNGRGALDVQMEDGTFMVDGVFHLFAVRIRDGKLDLTLRDGSRLTAPSSITSSDASVRLHLPRGLSADLDVHSKGGDINSSFPTSAEHDQSGQEELSGKPNGGNIPLTIRTGDGNISIQPL